MTDRSTYEDHIRSVASRVRRTGSAHIELGERFLTWMDDAWRHEDLREDVDFLRKAFNINSTQGKING